MMPAARSYLRCTLLLLSAWGTAAPPVPASGEVRVEHFAPQETVKDVRQVKARFSAPMVALGDPRLPDPFSLECGEPGSGSWIDSRTWIYDFDRDLPGGVRCRLLVQPDLHSLAGDAVVGQREFAFSTGGPVIEYANPSEGSEQIDEEQAFLLAVNAEPTSDTVLANVSFSVDGLPERIGVRVFTGAEKEAVLATLPDGTRPEGPSIVLQARQRFPSATRVRLVWGTGVTSASGVATTADQMMEFATRPAFTAQFGCRRVNDKSGCIPITPIHLNFTAAVPWAVARQVVLAGPGGETWSPREPDERQEFVSRLEFLGPFPESTQLSLRVPADVRDDAGRSLANGADFPLAVKTDPFPPLAKFAARFGIIESETAPALPVTLRNLEPEIRALMQGVTRTRDLTTAERLRGLLDRVTGEVRQVPPDRPEDILPWLRRVARARRAHSVFAADERGEPPPAERPRQSIVLPKPSTEDELEVVGIPLPGRGLHVVELQSPRLGAALLSEAAPMYVPAAALVTNLSVHFKWGREGSLVWVTSLDDARPVGAARVTVQDCRGEVRATAITDGDGLARFDDLPGQEDLPNCYEPTAFAGLEDTDYDDYYQSPALNQLDSGLFIVARTDDDLSFVHSSWSRGIEPWRFRLPDDDAWSGPVSAHTILARSLLRAGDTVHMKHVLRLQTLRGFALVPDDVRPDAVRVQHVGSDERYDVPLAWAADGSAESTWTIPPGAKLGRYNVLLRRGGEGRSTAGPPWMRGEREWISAWFRVEEFRVPLLRAAVQLPAEPQVDVTEVPADVTVQYLAGGAAGDLPVVLRTRVRERSFSAPEDFEHFTFANGGVREGIAREGSGADPDDGAGEESAAAPQRRELTLDASGAARTVFADLPRGDTPRELLVELELRDPNGELQTVSSTVPLWPASQLVGIDAESWAGSDQRKLDAVVAVVDTAGRPVAGAPVRVDAFERRMYSHRKRLVGGFYGYEHVVETRAPGALCEGRTDDRGRFFCSAPSPLEGRVVLQATTTDAAARASTAHTEVWVAGERDWWFAVDASDRIDLLPERRRYEPGETARFQVRMPFQHATALVTLEREGILEASVVPLSGRAPVIEVPVHDDYAPNVFVSALVVRGRLAGPAPTAMVDLAKPAYKLGIAEIGVGWREHELRVAVTTDRESYTVRDKAKVKVAVRTADGQAPPAGSEVALAVVDEGLLELLPNTTWRLLDEMMGRRGYAVRTASAQSQVIGKRHYGRKAVPAGGGGGRQATRELFDTLLLWQARVPLDERGEAEVEVPLNDSLTAFRLVAVATAGLERFGTGTATIRSTQDLMMLSGLAPLVRVGDAFTAEVTLRNTTSRALEVNVRGRVEEMSDPLAVRAIELGAGEARVVEWPIVVPDGVEHLTYELQAGVDGGPTDSLRVRQQVRPAVPVRVLQSTITRWEPARGTPLRQPVARPAEAIAGRGGIEVSGAANLSGGLDGVRDWIRRYPYTCFEQRLSRAVALRDQDQWRSLVAALPSYVDADGLVKFFPTMTAGSEVLTAYVVSLTAAAGWPLPPELQKKLSEGLRAFVEGRIARRSDVQTADLSVRKLAAVAALAGVGAADPALLESIAIEPNLWPTSALLDWWSVLSNVPEVPDRAARTNEVQQILRARLDLRGTVMGFSTERTDHLWWLMAGPDLNAVRLLWLATGAPEWRDDMPRLMRGALARQKGGAWDTTLANVWGALAAERFSAAFEATPVTGDTSIALVGAEQTLEWTSAKPPAVELAWPSEPADLAVDHRGTGHPWLTITARAAVPLREPLASGYRITRTATPIEAREPGMLSRGDRVRVRLEIEAQSDMTWVVVDDPIPAGASHLGGGLARDSAIGVAGSSEERLDPTFEERPFDAYRAYYQFLPKGPTVVEYVIRLNQAGRFELPPTRVEALYAPEMFGESPNAAVEVRP